MKMKTAYQHLRYRAKTVLGGKFVTVITYIKKQSKINNLTSAFRNYKKDKLNQKLQKEENNKK